MSTDDANQGHSRQTNPNKCETSGSDGDAADPADADDLPTADDVLWRVVDELDQDLISLPVATEDGTPIRLDYADETVESWESEPLLYCGKCGHESGDGSTFSSVTQSAREHVVDAHAGLLANVDMTPAEAADEWVRRKSVGGETVTDVESVSWVVAVERLLESHERTRETTINLRYGWPRDDEFAEFSFSATDRWSPEYQAEFYAQCQGWLRELTGGDRPSGGRTEAFFDEPSVAFLTRSATSVPDGARIGPVDHVSRLRDSWRECYQKLRYALERAGFENDDYQFWRVTEPHPGSGQNRCYAHEHVIVVADGDLRQSDLASVMRTHVEATDGAGADAHTNTPCGEHGRGGDPWDDALGECDDCDTPVSVRDPESVENLAAYVADYASIDPVDLFERPAEYVAYAAAMTAGNVRSVSRADPAGWAATADRCRQRAESGRCDQEHDHGDRVRRSDKGTNTIECAECGSPHAIDQSRTLTSHRVEDDADDATMVADGGDTDLWAAWLAAWKAGRKRTAVKECRHPDGSNQCPLCDEYRGVEGRHAVDAAVPIPEDTYVPDEAFENEAVEWVEAVEDVVRQRRGSSPAAMLGQLHADPDPRLEVVPDEHLEALVRGVLAGLARPAADDLEDDPDWLGGDRVKEWRIHSLTIDGEEHSASAGHGVEMTEVQTGVPSWSDTRVRELDDRLVSDPPSRDAPPEWVEDAMSKTVLPSEDPWHVPGCQECDVGLYDLDEQHAHQNGARFGRFVCTNCGHEVVS